MKNFPGEMSADFYYITRLRLLQNMKSLPGETESRFIFALFFIFL